MKKIIGLLAVAVLMSVSAFSQKPTYYAKVNKVEGLYIYVNAEPVDQYEELGYLKKKGLWWQCQYTEIFNYFFKRCKKEYPRANALILYLSAEGGKATAIYIPDVEKVKESEQLAK